MKKAICAFKSIGLAVILFAIISSLAVSAAAEVFTPWIGVEEEIEKPNETQDETTTDSTDGSQSSGEKIPNDGAQPSGGEVATAKETSTAEAGVNPQKKKGCGSTVSICGIGIYFMLAGAACIATKAGRRKRV